MGATEFAPRYATLMCSVSWANKKNSSNTRFGQQTGKIVYTGFFSSLVNNAEPIAFTSTSSSSINPTTSQPEIATCGMMLGCTQDDMKRSRQMLQDTPRAWKNHPMLVPLIFIELQSRRLRHLVDKVTGEAVLILDDVKEMSESSSNKMPRDLIKRTMDVRVMGSTIQEDLARAARQLANIIGHCECLLDSESTLGKLLKQIDRDGKITQTFLNRLKEVAIDYEDLIADCKINSEQAALFLDVVSFGLEEAYVNIS